MKNKEFDCVEMKHRAAEKISNELKHFTPKERLSYWNKRYQRMKARMTKRTSVTR
jgi:hypothetical protein